MKKQMYFAGATCDKVSENTIAFQMSTVKLEIVPGGNHDTEMWERLRVPMKTNPKGLVGDDHPYKDDYSRRPSHIGQMCEALLPEDHYFEVSDLIGKMTATVMGAPDGRGDLRLVAVSIVDGRLVFKIWQPSGYTDIKVLPTELRGCTYFDFGLKMSLRARSGVRISCNLLDGTNHQFVVEKYHHRGKHSKVTMAKIITYRPIQISKEDTVPHFTGFMETLSVQ